MSKSNDRNFGEYAQSYDALYRDKDYAAECDFIERAFVRFGSAPVKHVLDLGCGTGTHCLLLSQRGYRVHGVERSGEMLALAKQKAGASVGDQLQFTQGDLRNVELGERFDAVLCMFAVLGYQTTNDALVAALHQVRAHLQPGGLFLCDFWYGPAVLHQRPSERSRVIVDGGDRIVRMGRPSMDLANDVVTVTYDLLRLRGDRVLSEVQEVHPMRFFFQPEIDYFMRQAGLRLERLSPFMQLDATPDEQSWNVSAIARAI